MLFDFINFSKICFEMNFNNDMEISKYFDEKKLEFLIKYIEFDSKLENQDFEDFYVRCILNQNISEDEKKKMLKKYTTVNWIDKKYSSIPKIIFFYYLKDTILDDQMKIWYKKSKVTQGDIENYFQNPTKIMKDKCNYLFGLCYLYGFGFPLDNKKAFKIFQKGAETGDSKSQNNLGYCYDGGLGVKKDYKKAMKYYKLSAKQGNVEAWNNIGFMYEEGMGVKKNHSKAYKYYKKSADEGFYIAQTNIATLLYAGSGVEQDILKALSYYELAANGGDQGAQLQMSAYYSTKGDNEMSYKYCKTASEQPSIDDDVVEMLYNLETVLLDDTKVIEKMNKFSFIKNMIVKVITKKIKLKNFFRVIQLTCIKNFSRMFQNLFRYNQ